MPISIILMFGYAFFVIICIGIGLFYLIRKAYQYRHTIIRLPFTLYEKFITRSNLLVMFITLGIAVEATHILLILPKENITNYTQFILSPQGRRLLILIFVFIPTLCRIIFRRFLDPMNLRVKLLDQIASLWWPSMILLSYIFNVAIFYDSKSSPITNANEKMIIIFTFICFWAVASSAVRRLQKVELNYS